MGVGTPFENALRIFKLQNLTDVPVYISFDGLTDHIYLPPQAFEVYDISTNRINNEGYFIAEGTRIYVKEAAASPTSGSVYVGGFSASEV